MDTIQVELGPFTDETRLVAQYHHPSVRLLLADQPRASDEELIEARQTAAFLARRPLSREEAATVRALPGTHELRPFGEAHDLLYWPESRSIVEADFLVPEEAWVVAELFPRWPKPAGRAALILAEETAAADADDVSDVPVGITTDEQRSQVLIDLCYAEGEGQAYELGDGCLAVVAAGALTAIFARLG